MANNQVRLRSNGFVHTMTWDTNMLMGDVLEELEDHLGGEGVVAWLTRLQVAFERGVRVRDFRTRDILGMVFIARSQADPGITWRDVSKVTAPYAVEIVEDEEPEPAVVPAPVAPEAPTQPVPTVPAEVPPDVPSVSPVVEMLAQRAAAQPETAPAS